MVLKKELSELATCLAAGSVVPFIGAGLSVEGGFPSWKDHLRTQRRTAGITKEHIEVVQL